MSPKPMHPVEIMQNMPMLFKMTAGPGEKIDYNEAVKRFKAKYLTPETRGLFD